MTRIVFLDRSTIGPSVSITKPSFAHEWTEFNSTQPEQVAERASGAQIVITNKVPLGRETLAQLPDLKLIVVAATGYDVIDLDACRENRVLISNVRGYALNTVPEHVLALIFALRRSLVGYRQDVINGEWQRAGQFCFFSHPIKDLAGQTLGIIGRGVLARASAKLAEALGMKAIYCGRKNAHYVPEGYTEFDQFLQASDVITVNCPLTPETRNLLGYSEFQKMQRKPLLINAGRGGLVNETDVVRALDEGLLSGIGFDCLTSEPMAENHPFKAILHRPNVIITPHVAWASDEAMQTLWDQVIFHIENFSKGRPSNVLN